jgi:hydrogenase nickel incorporation protein HypB
MCETCGCGDHELVSREIQESLLAGNQRVASHNREHFARDGVLALNLMGSPGCGKTALLEATARTGKGKPEWRMAAMSGDLATDRDARRLEAAGIPAATLTTGSACHLDAELVHRGLHDLEHHLQGAGPDGGYDLLFIENVGNLVCPAIYDLGQAANVVALSVTEGEDKPLKYPVMFHKADLVVLTKVDLLPHLPGVRIETFEENVARVMPAAQTIAVSAMTGDGIERWIEWLAGLRDRIARPASPAATAGEVQRA